jgi:hypothetical protein
MFNGNDSIRTQNYAAETTGATVRHRNNNYYDIGLNICPQVRSNISFTWNANESGGYAFYSGSASYTITLTNQTDLLDGSTLEIIVAGTNTITIARDTGVTLWWADGTAGTTFPNANRTVSLGWAVIRKIGSATYLISGIGVA